MALFKLFFSSLLFLGAAFLEFKSLMITSPLGVNLLIFNQKTHEKIVTHRK